MAIRDAGHQSLTHRGRSVQTGHFRVGAASIDKHQSSRRHRRQPFMPMASLLGHVGPTLLGAVQRFFTAPPQSAQPDIHRRGSEGAIQPRSQFGQRGIRLVGHQLLQARLACGGEERLTPAQMGLGSERAPRLELLAHSAHCRHTKVGEGRDLAGAFALLVKLDDPLTHRNWDGSPTQPIPQRKPDVELHHLWKCSKIAPNQDIKLNVGRWGH